MIEHTPVQRILIGINLTPASRHAFYEGLEIAARYGAETYILHVAEPIRSYDLSKKRYVETTQTIERIEEGVRHRVETLWKEGGLEAVDRRKIHIIVRGGKASQELVDSAVAKRINLIVIGLGSGHVAERVVRNAPCSIHCVKPPRTEGPVI